MVMLVSSSSAFRGSTTMDDKLSDRVMRRGAISLAVGAVGLLSLVLLIYLGPRLDDKSALFVVFLVTVCGGLTVIGLAVVCVLYLDKIFVQELNKLRSAEERDGPDPV
jgi:NADH:ubiquinone oxidoreductase subunit K